MYVPAELLTTQYKLTGRIQHLIAELDLLATRYSTAVLRFAAFAYLLLASQTYHFTCFSCVDTHFAFDFAQF